MAVVKETTYVDRFTRKKEVDSGKPTKIDEGGNNQGYQDMDVHEDESLVIYGDRVCLLKEEDVELLEYYGEPLGDDLLSRKHLVKDQINEANLREAKFGGRVETVFRYVPTAPGALLDYAHKVSQGKADKGEYLKAVENLKLLEAQREKAQVRKEKVAKVVNKLFPRK